MSRSSVSFIAKVILFISLSSLKGISAISIGLTRTGQSIALCGPLKTVFHASSENLTDLPRKIFYNCSNLLEINLSNNLLVMVENGLISKNNKLVSIDLSINLLQYLSPDFFSYNPNLTRINLSGNRLVNIDFQNLVNTNLQDFNFANNYVFDVPEHILCYMEKIRLEVKKQSCLCLYNTFFSSNLDEFPSTVTCWGAGKFKL